MCAKSQLNAHMLLHNYTFPYPPSPHPPSPTARKTTLITTTVYSRRPVRMCLMHDRVRCAVKKSLRVIRNTTIITKYIILYGYIRFQVLTFTIINAKSDKPVRYQTCLLFYFFLLSLIQVRRV